MTDSLFLKLQSNHNKRNYFGYKENKCCICYKNIGKQNVIITNCNHTFHSTCLLKWTNKNKSCPLCRNNLYDEDNTNNKIENITNDLSNLSTDCPYEEYYGRGINIQSLIYDELSRVNTFIMQE